MTSNTFGLHLRPFSRTSLKLAIFGLLISLNVSAQTLIHPKSNDPKENLVAQILQLALSHNDSGTRYEFQQVPSLQTESRSIEMLKEGAMSVMWAGTQIQYEQELRPIRIPVLKGLLGHRIFIIPSGRTGEVQQGQLAGRSATNCGRPGAFLG